MNIGILVHSYTGNTLSVAKKIKERLINNGHTVNIEKIVAKNENPNSTEKVVLESVPDINKYDICILGAPVRGFLLSNVMKEYLNTISIDNNKEIYCFVTHFFPYDWMGGKTAINEFRKILESKKVNLKDIGIIGWSNKKRENNIDILTQKFDNI